MTTELFGLTLNGDIPTGIPTNLIVILEYLDDDGDHRLRYLSTDMTLWARIGMLHAVIAGDQADIVDAFEDDDTSHE